MHNVTPDSPVGDLWPAEARPAAAVIAHSALRYAGVRTVGQLTLKDARQVRRMDGIGPKALEAIRAGLAVHGLALAGEQPVGYRPQAAKGVVVEGCDSGISRERLRHWIAKGYVRPLSVPDGPGRPRGSGGPYGWAPAEAEVVRRMGRLVDAGITPARAVVFARGPWPCGEIAPGVRIEVTG